MHESTEEKAPSSQQESCVRTPTYSNLGTKIALVITLASAIWIYIFYRYKTIHDGEFDDAFCKLFPGKQAITTFSTKFHAVGRKLVMTVSILVCGTLAHEFLMDDPERIQGWLVCCFFLALLLLFVLFAIPEVSGDVCRLLSYELFSLVLIDLIRRDYVSAIASGVTCFVCWMVVVTEFGGGEAEVSV
ncbi:hypothetical protein POM88_030641 [Heracleum sosnowskyi]|uniref:Transmembrane protein n=1 Tax=Heracleum sosnowskyi TaxID=360622 RepID=A0AAD8MJK1_9APIA|nr:hypothetical protein POM88_030641 [Heracleum sosnowskyi]